jgi:hypothetical protein
MARRATSALAGVLACVTLALPAALLTSQEPAAAATGQPAAQPPASIFITGMNPQWASASSTITVTGTLRNTSGQAGQLTVQLLYSPTPVGTVAQLQADASQPETTLATTPLSAPTWQTKRPLSAGASVDWSIKVRASALNMTNFGVYPLAAQAFAQDGTLLGTSTTTYLPYEPDRKGAYASSRPAPAKIAWLWPLIDEPLLNEPWQGNCSGAQATALVQSLGSDGRLGELVQAGDTDAAVTWMVDPAVLANVQALTTCSSSQPLWAKAASSWLTELKGATSGRPLTVTPYGDPNVPALRAVGRGGDVTQSFTLGRSLAGNVLGRNLNPATSSASSASTASPLTQATGIAWSATGVPGYGTVEDLANLDGVSTLVLSTSAFPAGQGSVLKTLNGGGGFSNGGYITALLASQSLTQLLGSPGSATGSAFATGQQFLAETALLAQIPGQPIVVAPPPRWDPPRALGAGLLADTTSKPWLSQVTLTSLAATKHIPSVPNDNWPRGSVGPTRVTRPELRKLRTLDREIVQLENLHARPAHDLFLAVSTLESSAWQGVSSPTPAAMLATLSSRIAVQQQGVLIIAEKRITLGGLKGSVPVSIDNRLGYPVRVQLQLQYSQADGMKITADPQGLVTVAPRQTQTIRLRVLAAQDGSTTVTMLLASPGGQSLGVPQRMTIQATQVGVLGMIILAAALGIFLIASAARAVRRGRPGTSPDQPASDEPARDHDRVGSADRGEPDTVEAERTELGAVGKPGP